MSRRQVLTLGAAGISIVMVAIMLVQGLVDMAEAGLRSNYFARQALHEAQTHAEAGEYLHAVKAQIDAHMLAVDHTWRLALIRPAMRHVLRPMADQREYTEAISLCNMLATFERYNSPEGTGAYYQCRVLDEERYTYEACLEDCSPIYCTQVYGLNCP